MVLRNDSKLANLLEKKRRWLAEVEKWRKEHFNHPDYHADHAEEIKFRKTLIKVDTKIETLKRQQHKYLEQVTKFK